MPGMQHDQMKMEGPKDVPSAAGYDAIRVLSTAEMEGVGISTLARKILGAARG